MRSEGPSTDLMPWLLASSSIRSRAKPAKSKMLIGFLTSCTAPRGRCDVGRFHVADSFRDEARDNCYLGDLPELVCGAAAGCRLCGRQSVVLLTTVVLAWILAPEQFGLVSLALHHCLRRGHRRCRHCSGSHLFSAEVSTFRAALLCTSLIGVLLVAAGVLTAPLIGDFFGRQDVAPIVRPLLAVSSILCVGRRSGGAASTSASVSPVDCVTVTRAVATGVVSIGLAAAHSGAWALAWGTLAGTFSTRSPYGYLYRARRSFARQNVTGTAERRS